MPLSLLCYLFTFLFFYTPLIILSALFSYLLVIPRSIFLFYHFIHLFTSSSAGSAKGTDCTDVLGLFFQKILVTGIFMHISFMYTCGLFLSLTPFYFLFLQNIHFLSYQPPSTRRRPKLENASL